MKLKCSLLIFCLSFLITTSGISQESRLLTTPGLFPEIHGVIEKPSTPGIHPAVIILYGSQGWAPVYAAIAKDLADSGFVALALDYYAYKEGNSVQAGNDENWSRWQSSVKSAVTFLMEDTSVKRSVGLLGYSLGSFLAVSIASSIPEVKGVVEYFGGGSSYTAELNSQVKNFPPLLILHGEEDQSVPVSKAYELRDAVLAQGGEVEIKIYPGAGHGFNASWLPIYNEAYANDSFQRTIDFFRRKL
ncbi:MAG: dienelactone hydrolase family protein [Prolixibacteraceae bacterium]|nr:dienelactone hydrolase family protein [Prolixibacteraceae bacterium]